MTIPHFPSVDPATGLFAGSVQSTQDNRVTNKTNSFTPDASRSLSALSRSYPVRRPATVTTPVVAWNASPPVALTVNNTSYLRTATPPHINPVFTLSGFNYVQAGGTTPDFNAINGDIICGNNAVNFGSSVVDFTSDAPLISIPFYRAQSGKMRIVVDGVEVVRIASGERAQLAQGGTSTTVTLDTGSNAADGYYATRWAKITAGTGIGQVRQIVSYVGATKVATVNTAWTTTPDTTSMILVSWTPIDFNDNFTTSGSVVHISMDWSNERRIRNYHVETYSTEFMGVYTAPVDQLNPAPKLTGPRCIWIGDSYSEGTGSEAGDGLAFITCRSLGWELWNISVGGSGYLNGSGGNGSMNYIDRCFPPFNSWRWYKRGSTGAAVITVGTTPVAIPAGATAAAIQTLFDTAFGTGQWQVFGGNPTASTSGVWFLPRGNNQNDNITMTLDAGFLATNPWCHIDRWAGDLEASVPVDGNGNEMPFAVVLSGGHNDTSGSNPAFTTAALKSAVTLLVSKIQQAHPTATVIVLGFMYLPGGSGAIASAVPYDQAMLDASDSVLNPINGKVPYIPLLNLFTGTGYLGNLKGDGTSDYGCHTDGIHPSVVGHAVYGASIAQQISSIIGRS
jgi:lysophospholipase L1-like esterase